MAAPITGSAADGSAQPGAKTGIVLALAFAVFFILGGVTNINDLLVGKFKPMFHLSHAQANLVQMAFFIAYALCSIPAGIVMSKLGYIRTFVLGFVMVAAAAFLFIPASAAASYPGFLAALFFIGAGITVLQVAMNPIITTLGPVETSHSRLTFAQAFNSIGVFSDGLWRRGCPARRLSAARPGNRQRSPDPGLSRGGGRIDRASLHLAGDCHAGNGGPVLDVPFGD